MYSGLLAARYLIKIELNKNTSWQLVSGSCCSPCHLSCAQSEFLDSYSAPGSKLLTPIPSLTSQKIE